MEQGLLVVLEGRDSLEGADTFLVQEWLVHPWVERVSRSLVRGWRKPILGPPWPPSSSRMD